MLSRFQSAVLTTLLGGVVCLGVALRAPADDAPATPPAPPQPRWNPVGVIDRNVVTEISGVVASRKYPGVLWVHADSGNEPKIVAVNSNGARIAEVTIAGAPNIDWEDICADDSGNIYVGDIGNNTGLLPVRYVYRVPEPDPYHPPTKPVPPDRRWRVRYPEGERSNCESLFWHAGTLYVIPRGGPHGGVIYRLDPDGNDDLIMHAVCSTAIGPATGADVSRDGRTLLICGPYVARLYRITDEAGLIDPTDQRMITTAQNGAVEACCLTEQDVVLIPENGCVYRVPYHRFDEHAHYRLGTRRPPAAPASPESPTATTSTRSSTAPGDR